MSEIEETFQRISQRPNVTGIIVVDSEGTPIRSTIEDTAVQNQYANLITALAAKARHCVRDLDPTNDLSFLRIRSKKNEIMVAPDKDFFNRYPERFRELRYVYEIIRYSKKKKNKNESYVSKNYVPARPYP
ncbi:dynein light chain roadblock-type [Angomonas deanei]|nr:dynein light chain roadblock-type [Angomonas deanei]|eukprot:EPY39298.1 dynein light chain roadblock-type [Angomonas deanei]